MVAASDLVLETQRLLAPYQRDIAIVLSSNYTAGGASLSYTDGTGINAQSILPGCILSIDLELFYVLAAPSGGTISVAPGYYGSTQANHTANALIYINRKFTNFETFQQINHVLDELGGEGLYNLGTIEFVYNAVQQAYDLTDINTGAITGYIEGVSLRYRTPLPSRKYGTIPSMKWEVLPNMSDDANFPSGYCLILNDGGWPGQNMLFNFKQSFPHFVNWTDSAQTVALLPATANDLPPMGAMIRMVAPREVQRNQTQVQPDSRLAPEVPPGAVAASTNAVRANYQMRISEEKARLKRNVGQMRRRY